MKNHSDKSKDETDFLAQAAPFLLHLIYTDQIVLIFYNCGACII